MLTRSLANVNPCFLYQLSKLNIAFALYFLAVAATIASKNVLFFEPFGQLVKSLL